MTARDFCYWMQGWFELNGTIDHRAGATPETLATIEKRLALVFVHEIDPSHDGPKEQKKRNAIHDKTPAHLRPNNRPAGLTALVDPAEAAAVKALEDAGIQDYK